MAYFKADSTCNGTGVEFTEMYSYTASGHMTSKRLYTSHQYSWPNSNTVHLMILMAFLILMGGILSIFLGRRGKLLIFLLTPRGLRRLRLETTLSCKISASTWS